MVVAVVAFVGCVSMPIYLGRYRYVVPLTVKKANQFTLSHNAVLVAITRATNKYFIKRNVDCEIMEAAVGPAAAAAAPVLDDAGGGAVGGPAAALPVPAAAALPVRLPGRRRRRRRFSMYKHQFGLSGRGVEAGAHAHPHTQDH